MRNQVWFSGVLSSAGRMIHGDESYEMGKMRGATDKEKVN